LDAPAFDPGDVILRWTATGDDGDVGRATSYDLRYVPAVQGPIDTEAKWNQAFQIGGEPVPSPAGQPDSILVRGLTPGASYYFCIKAIDDRGNMSAISNSPLMQAAGEGGFITGDVDGSGVVNGVDLLFFVNYLKGGPSPPTPLLRADCNGNCRVNGTDVYYLFNYLRGFGPPPVRGNCDFILAEKKDGTTGQ
jgi:hypothetical protein